MKMNDNRDAFFESDDGSVRAWIVDAAAVHLRCVTKDGDPVELNADEVRNLCEALLTFASQID